MKAGQNTLCNHFIHYKQNARLLYLTRLVTKGGMHPAIAGAEVVLWQYKYPVYDLTLTRVSRAKGLSHEGPHRQ